MREEETGYVWDFLALQNSWYAVPGVYHQLTRNSKEIVKWGYSAGLYNERWGLGSCKSLKKAEKSTHRSSITVLNAGATFCILFFPHCISFTNYKLK